MPVLGIDIGGTRIKAGIVSADGRVLASTSAPTPDNLDRLRATVTRLVTELAPDRGVTGCGFGCRGIINPADTLVERLPGTLAYLEGTHLSTLVPLDLPMAADNDARAALAGELAFGAARGCRDALMLTLGTGVGGAIVADGRLLRGASGVAGHVGHLTVDPDGPPCICGNRGCLETFFSARAIELDAVAAIHRGCASLLRDRFAREPLAVTTEDVFACAAAGDEVARGILARALHRLGGAVAGLLHLLDPEIVIVGGQIAAAGETVFGPLRDAVHWRTRTLLGRAVPLVPPQVTAHAGVVGAAALLR